MYEHTIPIPNFDSERRVRATNVNSSQQEALPVGVQRVLDHLGAIQQGLLPSDVRVDEKVGIYSKSYYSLGSRK